MEDSSALKDKLVTDRCSCSCKERGASDAEAGRLSYDCQHVSMFTFVSDAYEK